MKKQNIILIILIATFALILIGASVLYKTIGTSGANNLVAGETVPYGTGDAQGDSDSGDPEEDYAAPDFTVTDRDGNEVRLSDYFGKPIVLNFWASWCGPCKSEMPHFNEAAQRYDGDVIFLMVNMTDGSRETVKSASAFIEKQGYTFPVLYDTKSEAAYIYSVYSIPTTYFIDSEGTLIAGATGAIDSDTLEVGIGMINK